MGETGVILLAGMIEQKLDTKKDLTRTLKDVAVFDYFATQKIIREIFVPGFDSKQYDDEITQGFELLNNAKNKLLVLADPTSPDFVKRNKITLGLYYELVDVVDKNQSLSSNPVAFGLSSMGLKQDIEDIKNSNWGRTMASTLTDPDRLSFVVFTKYWHVLNSRARILKK